MVKPVRFGRLALAAAAGAARVTDWEISLGITAPCQVFKSLR